MSKNPLEYLYLNHLKLMIIKNKEKMIIEGAMLLVVILTSLLISIIIVWLSSMLHSIDGFVKIIPQAKFYIVFPIVVLIIGILNESELRDSEDRDEVIREKIISFFIKVPVVILIMSVVYFVQKYI